MLSIRGTLSLEDCITDFLCEPAILDDWIKEVGTSGASGASFEECAPPVQKAGEPGWQGCLPPSASVDVQGWDSQRKCCMVPA